MSAPIIFVRQWNPTGGHFPGLPVALKCGKKWNPNGRVILIGDEKQLPEVKEIAEFHPLEKYVSLSDKLKALWPHHKHPDAWFLWSSLSAWLVVADWCKAHREDFVCVLDTDVLLFDEVAHHEAHWRKYDLAACNAAGTAQAPSFVTARALSEFVDYLFWLYSPRMLTHSDRDAMDACKDCMSAWRLAAQFRGLSSGNLCDVVDGVTFSHNAGMDYGGYEWNGRHQVFRFIKGQPHCLREDYPIKGVISPVRFVNIHCWGPMKAMMADLVRCSERP